MKVHAITESGKVIGTAQFPELEKQGTPFGGRVTPLPGQEVHVLDLPAELCQIQTPDAAARLHEECEKHIRAGTAKYVDAPSGNRVC